MNILIFNPYWATLGGGEKYVSVLAEVLSRLPDVRVTLLTTRTDVSMDRIQQYFRVNLSAVPVRKVGSRSEINTIPCIEGSTLIVLTNFRAVRTQARRTVYILQTPYGALGPSTVAAKLLQGTWRESAKDVLRMDLIRHCREVNNVIVYSEFVREVLSRHHGLQSMVIPPPIDDFLVEGTPKQRMILSVGRIFRGLYNDKRYDILIGAFRKLVSRGTHDTWTYHIAGSCGSDRASLAYLHELQELAQGYPVSFHLNCTYEELRDLYNRAMVFWHAAGFDTDEARHPERMEHFGMATVEAMSAGAIPIVVSRGGQKEIVSHGISGYWWTSVDDLVAATQEVGRDHSKQAIMRTKARERFREFNRERFEERVVAFVERLKYGSS